MRKKCSPLALSHQWLICLLILLRANCASAQTDWLGSTNQVWFTNTNWNPAITPNARTVATFANGGSAQILNPGAVAAELLLNPEVVSANVLVSGPTATLVVAQPINTDIVSQISIAPAIDSEEGVTSTLQIQDGATVTAPTVNIGAGGALLIGTGGKGGILNTPAIVNNGAITFNLTDTTTLSATITGEGTITKEGSGTAVLGGPVTASSLTISGGTLTVVNLATLSAPVTVTGPSSVLKINSGTATAENFELTVMGGGTLDNAGTIGSNILVTLDTTGAKVINRPGGVIAGTGPNFDGLDFTGTGSLQNSGSVSGAAIEGGGANGVGFSDGGSVTNNAGGTITGTSRGILSPFVELPETDVTEDAVNVAAQAANPAEVTVVNSGTISGATGVEIDTGGSVTNNAGGIIQGTGGEEAGDGIGVAALPNVNGEPAPLTVINSGTISGATGVEIDTGGSVTNTAGGSIEGTDGPGVAALPNGELAPQPLTVVNSGTITGTTGVEIDTGGSVTNNAGGLIEGTDGPGVAALPNGELAPQALTVVNSGTITGINAAIELEGGGSITNNAGSVIGGRSGLAILSAGGPTKFSNAGIVNGSVLLGNFPNTVQLFSGGRINGNLNLGNSAASNLILDGSTDQAISQAITGTTSNAGSLTKQGAGNWTVDVAMNAPVSTNILAGVLTVNSSLTSPLVTVQAGGMLKGSGSILGNVVNVGTISPGNSPGTLTISGNFTQGAGGTYNVEFFSPQNYSHLVVLGHASLDGTLHLTLASGFRFQPGQTYTVLTAQGISGTFRTISGNTPVQVTYANGQVIVNPAPARVQASEIHLSDGTPVSTTALLADYTFYGFGSLSERMALGLIPSEDTSKQNAVSLTFDAGEFDIQGQHGQTYTIPIAGGFKINDRVRLDYEIPLQYITIDNTSLFQAGLTLDLPVKVIIPTADQPWSWILTPTAAVATSGSKEIIGGGALTNVFSYQWHGITATYGNYISFFEGDVLTSNDPKFPSGVSQQIMKNGLRLDLPFAKSWIFEAYGIYTQFFQPAAISSYWTIGAEIGHHFTWEIEGRHLDLGYLSLGLYTEIGNQYSQYHSGHAQIGSAWRF
jgi:hypothetical protein